MQAAASQNSVQRMNSLTGLARHDIMQESVSVAFAQPYVMLASRQRLLQCLRQQCLRTLCCQGFVTHLIIDIMAFAM